MTIVAQGPLRLADLALMEGLNPTMLSRIAGKLEAAGLVDRVADTGDGRVVHLAASPEGRDLVAPGPGRTGRCAQRGARGLDR